ncbi:recombinase family protein [Mycobacterium kiyosense]|uniref:recombinase family protein n=1 Tax=Mycobacterium kiyosense TaxID=2871094 RepID=UPI002230AFCC|nr:recombinase family protein [Mycobacterium kiyosense]
MFGYTRVSTDEQADRRNGLEAQAETIGAEATRRGWNVEHFADEGVSGKAIGPKLAEVLQLLASGQGDGLVVAKLDRLSRSIVNAANIIEAAQAQGWSLVILDLGVDLTTAAGYPERQSARSSRKCCSCWLLGRETVWWLPSWTGLADQSSTPPTSSKQHRHKGGRW